LTAVALVHPAILLRHDKRKAHLAVLAGAVLPGVSGAIGAYIYGPYRDRLKQHIFIDAPSIGFLFERKEHLAFGAILLAWAAATAYALAIRAEGENRVRLRRFAHRGFVASAALAAMVAVLGTVVASFRTF
jgi:hypothetical protein